MTTATQKIVVMIADNTEKFGIPCSRELESFGYETALTAKDGTAVLEGIKKVKPDVLVMDVFLANIDAIGVLNKIKASTFVEKPSVILLSPSDSDALEREILTAGADYYFIKPVDYKELGKRIGQLVTWNSAGNINVLTDSKLERTVTGIMHEMGIPAHIKGYSFIREGIILSVKDGDILKAVTKILYPTIAEKFGTTPSRVERAIRHAIEIAWDRVDTDVAYEYFGYTVHSEKGKPTNSEFIAMIADTIRLNQASA